MIYLSFESRVRLECLAQIASFQIPSLFESVPTLQPPGYVIPLVKHKNTNKITPYRKAAKL